MSNPPSLILAPLPDASVYDGIEALGLDPDFQGFPSSLATIFDTLVAKHRPQTIIEVGSHKGGSASRWAAAGGAACRVYCVDTWLEAAEAWLVDPSKKTYSIKKLHGYPQTYFQFLTNMKRLGLHERIVPIPNTSSEGAIILKAHKIRAPIIYIDGSHTYQACYQDLVDYWDLLESGGSMLIDDLILYPDVYAALLAFCAERGIIDCFEPVEARMFGLITKP